MGAGTRIAALDVWAVRVPLARPYRLAAGYGTLTHSQAAILRLTLDDGTEGWGEADPHPEFDGYTLEGCVAAIRDRARSLIGLDVATWVAGGLGRVYHGSPSAAVDVACHDALARSRNVPLWHLLGEKRRDEIDVLWPTSNGDAAEDLEVIRERQAQGFRTFMLKMGDRTIPAEIERTRAVLEGLPDGVRIMVDSNQGWSRDEAMAYLDGCAGLPLLLVEQPLPADDLDGLGALRRSTSLPISVDESIQRVDRLGEILDAGAADAVSIKISKNGGIANSRIIAEAAAASGLRILMNSMIELGITQAASLQLGVTLDALMPCGHAYMSTLRMADDITDFSALVRDGRATLPNGPGLGVTVSLEKIGEYQVGEHHAR